MTNNTILNVPRKLLERVTKYCVSAPDAIKARKELRALLSAPSPAGVDGLHALTGEYHADCSALMAIIDGLRGEVAKINSDRLACWAEFKVMTRACLDAEKERDQQAHRISELEKLLYGASGELRTDRHHGLRPRIDAALSAGKEKRP